MINRIIIGLLFPFLKEVIFGKNIDPDRDTTKKSIAQRVIGFFMDSYRSTAALIIISILSIFVNVISIKKIYNLAINKEYIIQEDLSPTTQKVVKDKKSSLVGIQMHDEPTEEIRKEIIIRLNNLNK